MKQRWAIWLGLLLLLSLTAPILGVSLAAEQVFDTKITLPAYAMKTINVVPKKLLTVSVYKAGSNDEMGTIAIERIRRHAVIMGQGFRISIQRSGRKMMITNEGNTPCWVRVSKST